MLNRETGALMRPAPRWLGSFDLAILGNYKGRSRPIPPTVAAIVHRMMEAATAVGWELPVGGVLVGFGTKPGDRVARSPSRRAPAISGLWVEVG